jgi:uncharacterized protein YaiE (UPF0345 family)
MKRFSFFWWITQIVVVVLVACACSGCDEDDPIPPVPPVEITIPAGEDGSVEFEISNENGGDSGESASNPAVATTSEPLEMTISQTSSYTDPDGTVYECEPRAEIVLKADVDTVFVKDIQSLTVVSGNAVVTNSVNGVNPVTHSTKQTFSIGGQTVEFDLAYEVYTYQNSKEQNVEMPYIKLNNANFGSAESTETRNAGAVRLSNISVRPLRPATRTIEVTDSTEYEVTARFNLDAETANLATTTKKNISFEVVYVGVVTETNTYPGPEISYRLADDTGKTLEGTNFTVEPNSKFELYMEQSSSYTDKNGAVTATPLAWTRIYTPDVLSIENAEALASMTDKISFDTWFEEAEENIPYYKLGEIVLDGDVTVAEVSSENNGKVKIYKATATYKQKATPVNISDVEEFEFTYVVEYLGKVVESGSEFSYQLTDSAGNAIEGRSFTIEPNSTFELNIKQHSVYVDKDGNVVEANPVAYTKIATPNVMSIANADALVEKLSVVTIETKSDELGDNMPYYKFGEVVLDGEVVVAEESVSDDGNTQIYKATATYKQKAVPVNFDGGEEFEFTYVVEFLGKVSVALVDVEYVQEVIWEDAHDNIYTNSQIVITRKAKYSDGTVNETKFYSTKNFIQSVTSYDKKDTSGEIDYHNYGATDVADRTIATCATGVPDLEHFAYEPTNFELPALKGPVGVWTEYSHQDTEELYNEAVQTEGFYGKRFGYRYLVISEYINSDKYRAIRNYNIDLIYKDRFFCIDGKLFTCEPMEHTHRWSVETIETPNRGTCALHKLEADVTWLGRDFYYAVVDTVYVKQ